MLFFFRLFLTHIFILLVEQHQIRQMSSAQYYVDAGYKKSMSKINTEKPNETKTLESEISTNRTTTTDGIRHYIDSVLRGFGGIKPFYDRDDIQGLKFANYRGRQRVDAELVNIFVDGGQKYRPHGTKARRRRRRKAQDRRLERGRPRRRWRRQQQQQTNETQSNPIIKEK
jgi:hypothetical protein